MTMIVAVTGANGHLGRTLCRQLSLKGYHVRAVIRPGRKESLYQSPLIEVFEAGLDAPKDLEAAFLGVYGIFHTAAPTKMWSADPESDIIRPIASGTLNVVRSAAKAGVSKIIHTSTAAAVCLKSARPCNEQVWNDQTRHPQFKAKIFAEIEGAKLAAKLGPEFVSVCPPSVLGPGFIRDTPGTEPYRMLLQEKLPFLPPGQFHIIDVRDHAKAQICLMERSNLKHNRYILDGHRFELKEIMHLLSSVYPEMKLPERTLSFRWFAALSKMERLLYFFKIISSVRLDKHTLNECVDCRQLLDGSRFRDEFGFQYLDPKETFKDMMDYLALSEQGSH